MATTYTVTVDLDAYLSEEKTVLAPALDAVLVSSGATLDEKLSEMTITEGRFNSGMEPANLPVPTLEISLDDKIWSGSIMPEGGGPLDLPTMSLSASFGERAESGDTVFAQAQLPLLESTGNFAPRMDSQDLPDLRCTAAVTSIELLALVRNTLPSMTLDARSGLRGSADLKLPTMSVTMGVEGDARGTLSKALTFPAIAGEITGDGWGGTLDKDLPVPTITATGTETPLMSMSGTLPGMQITATAVSGMFGTLSETLPDLQITATALSEEFGTLAANLPTLTNQDWSGGSEGSAGSGTLTNRARFDDYILRHSRW